MGQGLIKADESGTFTIVDQLKSGLVMILTANDSQGRTGKPYSFRVPDAQLLDSLKILQVDYNHDTKILAGKTLPNVSVSIDYLKGTGSSAIDSDENGYFSLVIELIPDTQLILTANDRNGNWGEGYPFTVPKYLVSETEGSKDTNGSTNNVLEVKDLASKTKKSENYSTNQAESKGNLPSTGTTQNASLSSLDLLLLFGGIIGYKKKVTR